MGLVTLTFDLLTLKLVCESHQRWRTFLPNLGTLGLQVLELLAMYATDGQTVGRTDKSKACCLIPYERGHNNVNNKSLCCRREAARCFVPFCTFNSTSSESFVKAPLAAAISAFTHR